MRLMTNPFDLPPRRLTIPSGTPKTANITTQNGSASFLLNSTMTSRKSFLDSVDFYCRVGEPLPESLKLSSLSSCGSIFHLHCQRSDRNIGFGESRDLVGSQSLVGNSVGRTTG